jgi:hypothetical protein
MMEEVAASVQKENTSSLCSNVNNAASKNSSTLPTGCISVDDLNAHMVHGNSDLLQFDEEDLLGISSLDFSALQRAANSPTKHQTASSLADSNSLQQPLMHHNAPQRHSQASTSFFY